VFSFIVDTADKLAEAGDACTDRVLRLLSDSPCVRFITDGSWFR